MMRTALIAACLLATGGANWTNVVAFTPAGTISNLGSGVTHSITPPSLVLNCIVRVSQRVTPHGVELAANDNIAATIERRKRA